MKKFLLLVSLAVSTSLSAQFIDEQFSDGDFTTGTVWTGNLDTRWAVMPDAWGGPDAVGSNTLRLQDFNSGDNYLATSNSVWGASQGWGIWWGRQSALDLQNQQYFWLFADQPDVASSLVSGYRLALLPDPLDIGDPDVLVLQRVIDGVPEGLSILEAYLQPDLTDIGFTVRVTRSASGEWKMYVSSDLSVLASGGGDPATTSPYGLIGAYTYTGQETGTPVPIEGTGYIVLHTLSTKGNAGEFSGAPEFDRIMFQADGTLPVTLEAFKVAATSAGAVQLDWKVGLEDNLRGYEVERSANGVQFNRIGFVQATGSSSYRYMDQQPLSGRAFYRLKSTDLDGSFEYSSVVGVNTDFSSGMKLFPNPASNRVVLQHHPAAQSAVLKLYNAGGQLVRSQRVAENQVQTEMNISTLKPGLYMLIYENGNSDRHITRFIKQ